MKQQLKAVHTLWVVMALMFSCGENSSEDVKLFEPGAISGEASTTALTAGETVTYTDKSTKVHTRTWSFPGGQPATSTDPFVMVTYPAGGEYVAQLKITFVDNTKATMDFPVTVEGIPEEENPEPVITGATYGVFSEHANVTAGTAIWFINSNAFINQAHEGDAFEGDKAQSFIVNGTGPGADQTWAMGIIQAKDGVKVNLSQFAAGFLNVALKSTSTGKLRVRIRGTGLDASVHLTSESEEYGFKRDGAWHMISIPMADILAAIPEANRATALSQVNDLLILRSGDGLNITTVNNYNFDVDNVYYSENKPQY